MNPGEHLYRIQTIGDPPDSKDVRAHDLLTAVRRYFDGFFTGKATRIKVGQKMGLTVHRLK